MGPQIKMLATPFAGPLSACARPTCLSGGSLATFSLARCFSTTSPAQDWLTPKFAEKSKSPKGRPHVATGGSTRGTTVVWGDFGLRMKDHDRRMPASALKIAEETIKRRLRGMNYKLYKRVSANIGVYTKGNEQRMGKGKGKFDYWTVRLPVSRVVFELKGDLHEKIAREAFRLAGHKLPGMFWISHVIDFKKDSWLTTAPQKQGLWEFVKKDDPPVVGITKLGNGVTLESLKRPRRQTPLGTDALNSAPQSALSSPSSTQ
ncbi:Ribosomal protein L16 [Penicillium hispanicum]|uniref:Ribosomal protein L16 n=1 Tax=Penicillium hispanicum TaxID=1080232 RepID=UPI002540D593|nr:Ribosomal protein L16 [Penicillium hispanicum]KAJ5569427.1 Ribosomal protein L16 [Penicillium hispanicum]